MSLVKDPSKIIWVMLGSLRVGFASVQVLAHSLLSGLDSVRFLSKPQQTWVLVQFVLGGFVFFSISDCNANVDAD